LKKTQIPFYWGRDYSIGVVVVWNRIQSRILDSRFNPKEVEDHLSEFAAVFFGLRSEINWDETEEGIITLFREYLKRDDRCLYGLLDSSLSRLQAVILQLPIKIEEFVKVMAGKKYFALAGETYFLPDPEALSRTTEAEYFLIVSRYDPSMPMSDWNDFSSYVRGNLIIAAHKRNIVLAHIADSGGQPDSFVLDYIRWTEQNIPFGGGAFTSHKPEAFEGYTVYAVEVRKNSIQQ